jgi:hypothetical protein
MGKRFLIPHDQHKDEIKKFARSPNLAWQLCSMGLAIIVSILLEGQGGALVTETNWNLISNGENTKAF